MGQQYLSSFNKIGGDHLYLFNELPRKGVECWWAESGLDGRHLAT